MGLPGGFANGAGRGWMGAMNEQIRSTGRTPRAIMWEVALTIGAIGGGLCILAVCAYLVYGWGLSVDVWIGGSNFRTAEEKLVAASNIGAWPGTSAHVAIRSDTELVISRQWLFLPEARFSFVPRGNSEVTPAIWGLESYKLGLGFWVQRVVVLLLCVLAAVGIRRAVRWGNRAFL